MIEHHSLMAFLTPHNKHIPISTSDVLLYQMAFTFDPSVQVRVRNWMH